MKTGPVRAELFHADGQTDVTKLIFAFRNFFERPKNQTDLSHAISDINRYWVMFFLL